MDKGLEAVWTAALLSELTPRKLGTLGTACSAAHTEAVGCAHCAAFLSRCPMQRAWRGSALSARKEASLTTVLWSFRVLEVVGDNDRLSLSV